MWRTLSVAAKCGGRPGEFRAVEVGLHNALSHFFGTAIALDKLCDLLSRELINALTQFAHGVPSWLRTWLAIPAMLARMPGIGSKVVRR